MLCILLHDWRMIVAASSHSIPHFQLAPAHDTIYCDIFICALCACESTRRHTRHFPNRFSWNCIQFVWFTYSISSPNIRRTHRLPTYNKGYLTHAAITIFAFLWQRALRAKSCLRVAVCTGNRTYKSLYSSGNFKENQSQKYTRYCAASRLLVHGGNSKRKQNSWYFSRCIYHLCGEWHYTIAHNTRHQHYYLCVSLFYSIELIQMLIQWKILICHKW